MNKNYNFERKKLNLPEYGRNILKMVEFIGTIDDRELRNKQAHVVIDVMGNINTHLRDTDDLKHKLWDHLFIISNFNLDVDSPYPIPSPDSMIPHPDRIKYPSRKIARKHYGKNIENMLGVLKSSHDEESKQIIINNIAKYMRNKSHEYNQEHPNNEIVLNDIRAMSDNMIAIDSTILDSSKSEFKPQSVISRPKSSINGKSNFKKSNNKASYAKPGVQRKSMQYNKPKNRQQ